MRGYGDCAQVLGGLQTGFGSFWTTPTLPIAPPSSPRPHGSQLRQSLENGSFFVLGEA